MTIIIISGQLTIGLENQEKKKYGKGKVLQIAKGVESVLGNSSDEFVELFVIKR